MSLTSILGTGGIFHNFLHRPVKSTSGKPLPVNAGSGTAVISQPPTVVTPQNTAQAVMQANNTSAQLYTNTATGEALPGFLATFPGGGSYLILAGLLFVLLLAYAWDKGKL